MSTTIVTGASGLIGKAMCESLAAKQEVVGLSRSKPEADFPFRQGDFTNSDDLRQLDEYEIDAIIHLAAVTGGGNEPEFIPTNREGTRQICRYGI